MLIGDRIRQLREARFMSQEDTTLACYQKTAIRLSTAQLRNIETGRTKQPSNKTLHALAGAFGVSVEELLRGVNGA